MTYKRTDITNHKTQTTKLDQSAGQSFDIIPRSQVRPTVTARPVLTPTKPEQSDNTLVSSSQETSPQLTHKTLKFTTTSAPELSKDDAEMLLDKVASISAEAAKPKNKHVDEGKEADDPAAAESQEASADEATLPVDNEVVEAAEKTIEPNISTKDTTGTEDTIKTDLVNDDQEVGSASETVEPAQPVKAANADDARVNTEQTAKPEEGSLDHIFKAEQSQPIEHSQALKDELQGMDSKDNKEGSEDLEADTHPHHELYGGKPVIVIHKARHGQSLLSGVLWFIACLLVALLIVDVLLDAGVITVDYNIPHTHLLQ